LTTNQLLSKANNLAVALLKKGITKSDIICCHSENNIPYAILIFAAHFLGITVTSAKPKNNIYELENQIINSGSTIVFTSATNAHISEKVLQKVMFRLLNGFLYSMEITELSHHLMTYSIHVMTRN